VWVSTLRATNDASAASATVSGWIGVSTVPAGVDFVLLPELGRREAWPLVRP
jgi:hypothetical protein